VLPTFLKQILRVRSGGFTLMEVMVAAGLTGIASLAVIQLFGQTAKLQQESQVRSEMMQLRFLVKSILSSKENCEATVMFDSSSPTNITPIIRTTPTTNIPEGNYINLPNGIQRHVANSTATRGAIVPGSKFGGRLDITDIQLMHYTPRTSTKIDVADNRILDTGILEIKVSVNRKVYRPNPAGGQILVSNPVSIETPVMVSLDSDNNITGCIATAALTPQRITDEACEKFINKGEGAAGIAICDIAPHITGQTTNIQAHRERVVREELCRSLRGNVINGICQHPWAGFNCQSNYVISGFAPDGSRNFHCTRLPTVPSDCPLLAPARITNVSTVGTESTLTYNCVPGPP
jgi:type II secretory pathway pseudopilin PulG